jgi:hypothetical protein
LSKAVRFNFLAIFGFCGGVKITIEKIITIDTLKKDLIPELQQIIAEAKTG